MDRSRVAIVIPAYNETQTIAQVVRDVTRFGMPIVVDDASHDDTGEVSSAAGAVIVRHDANIGYDGALDAGFRRAAELNAEFVVTIDADGQHDGASVGLLIAELEKGADVVVGIRPKPARLAEWVFGMLTRLRFGIRDPLCGLKAYRMEVYRQLGHFDSRGSVGTELMLYAARQHRRVAQVPVALREREGAPRFGGAVRANMRILRAILRMARP